MEIDLLVLGRFLCRGQRELCSWKKRKRKRTSVGGRGEGGGGGGELLVGVFFLEKWVLLMIKVVLCSSSWIMM